MNALQSVLSSGFDVLWAQGGGTFSADTGETGLKLIVEPVQPLSEPDDAARAKQAVYARVHGKIGCVTSPRTVKTFTDSDTNGRTYTVLRYEEEGANKWRHTWFCEVQRG